MLLFFQDLMYGLPSKRSLGSGASFSFPFHTSFLDVNGTLSDDINDEQLNHQIGPDGLNTYRLELKQE